MATEYCKYEDYNTMRDTSDEQSSSSLFITHYDELLVFIYILGLEDSSLLLSADRGYSTLGHLPRNHSHAFYILPRTCRSYLLIPQDLPDRY